MKNIILLLLLFAAPSLLATFLMQHHDLLPTATVNRGILLDIQETPPLQSTHLAKTPWIILQINDSESDLKLAEQIRLLAGKNAPKVAVQQLNELQADAQTVAALNNMAASFVILDAERHMILKYPEPFVARDLHKDLKRLLYVEHLANPHA